MPHLESLPNHQRTRSLWEALEYYRNDCSLAVNAAAACLDGYVVRR